MNDGGSKEPTHQEIVARLDGFAMVAMAKAGKGSEASLLTWHRWLGHPSFKAVVDLDRSGVSGIIITDVPASVPGPDGCAACVTGKAVRERFNTQNGQFWINLRSGI